MHKLIPITVIALFGSAAAFTASAQPDEEQGPGDPAKAFIQQLDTDGDGKVSLDEALKPQGPRFSEVDADGDGVITAAEAGESFKAQVPPEMLEAMKERGMPDPGETFVKNLDKDDDGKVTREEFQQPAVQAFQAMDSDDDGFATYEEASAYFEQMKQHMQEQMQRMQQQQEEQQQQMQ